MNGLISMNSNRKIAPKFLLLKSEYVALTLSTITTISLILFCHVGNVVQTEFWIRLFSRNKSLNVGNNFPETPAAEIVK